MIANIIDVFAIALVFFFATYITLIDPTTTWKIAAIIEIGTKTYPSINFFLINIGKINGMHAIIPKPIDVKSFKITLNIFVKYSFISLSFICSAIDSVQLKLKIL